ncbi:hypothetical protein K7H08_15210 [Halomonas sp. IOP_6]|uniref:hypothetical protein n=1 Tax=Halomonas sp. IOP_6 TaxID=2876583 RepID=UPI001E5FA9F1|nr:hypothetical protein [Halomonas sp. IOP_6]MCD6006186.1 hypothetical protein [Halomonas sp. IOP_6]
MYYYRFLRAKPGKHHLSEIDDVIKFYTSDECGTNRDFVLNTPVKERMESGQKVQLLFGMNSLDDAVKVLSCFSCYKRVLARFELSVLETSYSIHSDAQVNERVGSKYIMADYNDEKICIPDEYVQVLSLAGWVAKSEAKKVLIEVDSLEEKQYEKVILNA